MRIHFIDENSTIVSIFSFCQLLATDSWEWRERREESERDSDREWPTFARYSTDPDSRPKGRPTRLDRVSQISLILTIEAKIQSISDKYVTRFSSLCLMFWSFSSAKRNIREFIGSFELISGFWLFRGLTSLCLSIYKKRYKTSNKVIHWKIQCRRTQIRLWFEEKFFNSYDESREVLNQMIQFLAEKSLKFA